MTILLWIAAAIACATFAVHTFIGGKIVARPLLADTGLPKASKWLSYYCWHVTTITIAFMALMFAWLAGVAPHEPTIIGLSSLATALSVLSAGIALKAGIRPLRFPSTSLFALTAAFGWAAVLAGY